MSTTIPAPALPRVRPSLTLRVLRGLSWLVLYGWDHIERMSPDERKVAGVADEDAFVAKRWVERAIEWKREAKGPA